MVGARSALFLPFPDLGLIVVDEEHDAGLQAGGRRRTTRPATWRWCAAVSASFPVVLASATPSIESRVNAELGRYREVALAGALSGGRSCPTIARHRPARAAARSAAAGCRRVLVEAVAETLGARRAGAAVPQPPRLCAADAVPRLRPPLRMPATARPGWSSTASAAGSTATIAAISMPMPEACPECGSRASLVACGPGVERIAEEVAERFPEARTRRCCRATWSPAPSELRESSRRSTTGEVDIVIGTQMVTKGHHFPNLDLVGVVDADLGLGRGDLRAAERTFQLLTGHRPRRPRRQAGPRPSSRPTSPSIR